MKITPRSIWVDKLTGVPYKVVSVLVNSVVYEKFPQHDVLHTIAKEAWHDNFVELQLHGSLL